MNLAAIGGKKGTFSQRIKVWVDGSLKLNTTDASLPAGGVAFGGVMGIDNLKIG